MRIQLRWLAILIVAVAFAPDSVHAVCLGIVQETVSAINRTVGATPIS